MTRPPKDEGAEQELWERVKDTVSPLKTRKGDAQAELPEKTKNHHPISFKETVKRPVRRPERQSKTTPGTAPEDRSSHKHIRRGRVEAQARIDLHGKKHDEAKAYLLQRLEGHYSEHLRCVLVITGRGERDEGVLRTSLSAWLGDSEFRAIVSGLAPAHTRHGGKGAWYVFLRRAAKL